MAVFVSITHDFLRLKDTLTNYERAEFPFAAALALTRGAQGAKRDLRAEMERVFDRPRPWTLNSTYVEPATKKRLEANVHFKDAAPNVVPAGRYLRPQIEGGPRVAKSSERLLRANGVLPQNLFLIPARGAERDAFGDVRSSLMVRILSAFNAFPEVGYYANASKKRSAGKKNSKLFSAIQPGHKGGLPPGIYRRTPQGGHILVFVFGRQPNYKPRFNFYGTVIGSFEKTMPDLLQKAMEQALRTSRR